MRNSHAAYGSSLSFWGASASAGLTAMISPETGAGISEAALTDSTTAQFSPRLSLRPVSGRWTYTTSPSWSCAWSVMPTVSVPSGSARTHWWLGVYFRSGGIKGWLAARFFKAAAPPANPAGNPRDSDHRYRDRAAR